MKSFQICNAIKTVICCDTWPASLVSQYNVSFTEMTAVYLAKDIIGQIKLRALGISVLVSEKP